MDSYTATVECSRPSNGSPAAISEHIMDSLDGFSPAVGFNAGTPPTFSVTLTVGAETLRAAVTTALSTVQMQTGLKPIAIDIATTEAFDARLDLEPVPELVSVTEAADELGVSRQAVLQRLESGSLPGTKVGTSWVIPAAALAAQIASAIASGRLGKRG